MAITHAFTSAKTDSADATLVRPTNWNDAHVVNSLAIPTTVAPQAIGDATPNFQVLGASGAASLVGIVTYSATAGANPELRLAKSANASAGSHTIVVDGENLGAIRFLGSNGATFDTAALILAEVDGTPGAVTDMPGRLSFWTTPDASATPIEALRIDNVGRLVTGAVAAQSYSAAGTIPVLQINVNASTANSIGFCRWQSGTSGGGGMFINKCRSGTIGSHTSGAVQDTDVLGFIRFSGSDGTDFATGAEIQAVVAGTPGDDDMPTQLSFFITPDASATTVERLRVSNTTTAADTFLMIYDVDNAALQRVSVGAAGSGGGGFKVLRIPD